MSAPCQASISAAPSPSCEITVNSPEELSLSLRATTSPIASSPRYSLPIPITSARPRGRDRWFCFPDIRFHLRRHFPSLSYQRRKQREHGPRKLCDSQRQKEQRHTQPQTAAALGPSGSAQLPDQRLAGTSLDAVVNSIEFQAAYNRKGDAHDRGREPVCKSDHTSSLTFTPKPMDRESLHQERNVSSSAPSGASS